MRVLPTWPLAHEFACHSKACAPPPAGVGGSDIVYVNKHLNLLPPHLAGRVGTKMQSMSREWALFLHNPEHMSKFPIVTDPDGRRLYTGQGTVRQTRLDAIPRDPAKRAKGDAWDDLPIVFQIGKQRIVRDGHHRLMQNLLEGKPVAYRFVTLKKLKEIAEGYVEAEYEE